MTAPNAPMSAEEVLAMMEQSARHADERGHVIAAENMRMAITAVSAMAEREAALVREVEELRADADRWRAIDWRWEDERDMGPGGRWVAVVWVNKGRPSVNAAIDAARAEARNG